MAYATLQVIVDGVLDDEETFLDETVMRDYVSRVEADAQADGYPTEVYIQYHEHELITDRACECYQYETSHKPAYAWNVS